MREVAALFVLFAGCSDGPTASDGPCASTAACAPGSTRIDGACLPSSPSDAAVGEPGDAAFRSDLVAFDFAPPVDLRPPRTWDLAVPPDLAPQPDLAVVPGNPLGIRFTDVSAAALGGDLLAGVSNGNEWGSGSGCAVADLDGDGRLDIVYARDDDVVARYPGGPSLFLRNGPPVGGFAATPRFLADADFTARLAGVRAHGVAVGDYDGDGDLDVFIAAEGPDFLLRNDGAGHFTDVSAAAGIQGPNDDLTNGAEFADLNHDGLLDLYVTNQNTTLTTFPDVVRNRLYLNLGDGTFADVSAASGTDNPGLTWAAGIFDLDGSGDLSIYVGNDRFSADDKPFDARILPDAWYRLTAIDGQGVPQFTDIAPAMGVIRFRDTMGVSIADVDGDLTPDLYLSNIGEKALFLNLAPGSPPLYATDAFNLGLREDDAAVFLITWGTRFCDLDRDGNLEVIVTNGVTLFQDGFCNNGHQVNWFLRRPSPAAPYEVVTDLVGLARPVPPCPGPFMGDYRLLGSRAAVLGDLDGDGDDDLVIPGYGAPLFVYRNDTPHVNHAVRIRLAGTVSSPDPIGATVVVTLLSGRRAAAFRAAGTETDSQGDAVLEIGIGADRAVTRAEVRWPSGITQRIDQLPGFTLDQTFTVTEPAWLTVEPRVVAPGDPPATLVYRPVDESGAPLGKAAAGRAVQVTRSDGTPVTVIDRGDGSYTAALPHPGVTRRSVLTITDGATLRPRPMLNYK